MRGIIIAGSVAALAFSVSQGAYAQYGASFEEEVKAMDDAQEAIDFLSVTPACYMLGYYVNTEEARSEADRKSKHAISVARNPASALDIINLTKINANIRAKSISDKIGSAGQSTADAIDFYDRLITSYEDICSTYASRGDFTSRIKMGPYPSKAKKRGGLGLIEALAENGDTHHMLMLASAYGEGLSSPDQDHKKEFYWTKRAADSGDSSAALLTSRMYSVGYGTAKDMQAAVMWGQIAIGTGCACSKDVATIKIKATKEQISKGSAEAKRWLIDREYE